MQTAKELRIREQLKPFIGKKIKIKFERYSNDWSIARKWYGDSYETIEPDGWLHIELTGETRQVGPLGLVGTLINGNRQRGKRCENFDESKIEDEYAELSWKMDKYMPDVSLFICFAYKVTDLNEHVLFVLTHLANIPIGVVIFHGAYVQ